MQKLILLIDDDNDEFSILSEAIEIAGLSHLCMWASGITRAEKLLQQMLPDLILIDYNMPINNGIACLEKIRQMKNMEKVPVCIYSSHISDATRRQAKALNASCLQKPDTIAKLVQCLNELSQEGRILYNQQ